MSQPFDRFTERARNVLQLAQDEARRLHFQLIDTEHLLLGLVREGNGVAARVLAALGVELTELRWAIELEIGFGEADPSGTVGLTPGGKKALELAVDERRRLNHQHVGTEHLLLGLLREQDGKAVAILEGMGVTLEKARRLVHTIVTTPASTQAESESPPPAVKSSSPQPFGKFTERSRKVLQLAQDEAKRFNHNYIGTEHLLLGLVREGDGVAARVLNNMGVQLPKVRSAVEFIIGRGESTAIGEIGLTPRAKKVLELAIDEGLRLNHPYVGTEHLLLGLVREGSGIAAGVLESLGVNLASVRPQVMAVISRSTTNTTSKSEDNPFQGEPQVPFFPVGTSRSVSTVRYTERAQKTLELASEEADRFNHNYIGTEHILLGLARQNTGTAARVLNSMGVQLPKIRSAVEFIIGRGESTVIGDKGLTPRSRQVLILADAESFRLQHVHIGTEHLLLGLIREGEEFAAGVLESLGVNLEKVRSALEQELLFPETPADPSAGEEGPGENEEETE